MAPEGIAPSALAHFDPADLLDALTTGIVMLDAQLCPTYANVAAQDLLAFSLKKARGRPFADFLHDARSEEHTSELQSRGHVVCRLLLEKNIGTRDESPQH